MIRIRFAPMTLALALALAVPMAHARGLSDRDLNFNYIASNRDGIGMVRAFDDGKRTIVQFVDLAQQRPMLTELNGTAIPYRAIGNYAVMDAIEPRFRVYSEGQMSVVSEIGLPPATLPASPAAGVETQPLESSPLQRALVVAAAPTPPPGTAKVPSAPKVAPTHRVQTVVLGADNTRAQVAAPAPSMPPHKPKPRAPTAPPTQPPPAWTVHRGETLHAALATWCKRAGWQLPQWDVRFNQSALASVTFHGTFVSAVTQLFDAYTQAARTQPGFHPLRVQVLIDEHLIHVMLAKDSNP